MKLGQIFKQEQGLKVKSGDLLIAISVNPYTKETIKACRFCKHQDVDIIVITDNLSSPLAMETDNFLIVPNEGDYFFQPHSCSHDLY